jgi:hypothetical protein
LAVGSTPLVRADRLASRLRCRPPAPEGRHPEPDAVLQGSRGGLLRRARHRSAYDTLACASTGNLAAATASRCGHDRAAVVRLRTGLDRAGQDPPRARTAPPSSIDGTYDDVNRLCIGRGRARWGFVNVNLRPFYAGGSKTLAFEIAEGLGWRTPDVIVAPIASGALFAKLAKGLREARHGGLIDDRPVGSWAPRRLAARLSPGRGSAAAQVVPSRARRRTRSCTRWRSAARPTGATRWRLPARAAAPSRPSATPRRHRRSGHGPAGGRPFPSPGGGVTVAAVAAARAAADPGRRRGRRTGDRQWPQDPGRVRAWDGNRATGRQAGLAPILRPASTASKVAQA